MKTSLLFAIGLACILSINASAQTQPPNAGFENWELVGGMGAEDPIDWSSLNESMTSGIPEMLFKTNDAHSGSFALRAISDTATIQPPFGTGVLDTVAAIVTLGVLNFDSPGIPYTDRPNELKVWVKGTIMAGDACFMVVKVSKWNTGTSSRDLIGDAVYVMTTSSASYTEQTIPFTYYLSDIPDTLAINIYAGNIGPGGMAKPGNEFFVDDISFTGTVCPATIANFTFTTSNLTANFIDSSTTTGTTTWLWDFGDGSPVDSTQDPSHTYTTDNTYNVCLTVTDSCGNVTYCDSVMVTSAVGIQPFDDLTKRVSVYPNPVVNELNIITSFDERVIFTIYDIVGKQIKSVEIEEKFSKVSTVNIPAGTYIYQVVNKNSTVINKGKFNIVR